MPAPMLGTAAAGGRTGATPTLLLAGTLLAACVTGRPAGAGSEKLYVEGAGQRWTARLGDQPATHAEAFRAAGFDTLADKEDERRSWGFVEVGAGSVFAAVLLGMVGWDVRCIGLRDTPQRCTVAFGIWSGLPLVWAVLAAFSGYGNLADADAGADAGQAAAASYNARLDIERLGATANRPERDQTPWQRRDDDLWHLNFLSALDPLARARLGVDGWKTEGRLERLGVNRAAFAAQLDNLFSQDRGSEGPWDRAEFALGRKAADAPALFEAAVADGEGAVRYAKRAREKGGPDGDPRLLPSAQSVLDKFAGVPGDAAVWVALGDVRATRGDKPGALEAYTNGVRAGPHDMPALRACGRALADAGRREEAVAVYAGAIAGAASDEDRFELLDRIGTLDQKWIHVNVAALPAGLLSAYEEHVQRVDRKLRLSRCLDACAGISWETARQMCRADCYAVAGD